MTTLREWILKHPIKCIILWGVFIRLALLALYGHATIFPDSYSYFRLAEYISHFDLTDNDGTRGPGYPLLIALAFGKSYITVLYQIALGIATLIVLYKTALLLWRKKQSALILTFIISCYLPVIFYEYAILTESLTLFLIMAVFFVFLKILQHGSGAVKSYLLLASLCAFLVLVKSFYIYIPFLLFAILFIRQHSFKYITTRYSLLIILPLFTFFGWSYVNKVTTGYFVSTTFYGFNMAQNCVGFAEKTTDEFTGIARIYVHHRDSTIAHNGDVSMSIWYAHDDLKKYTGLYSYGELSEKLYEYGTTTVKMNPLSYLRQVLISWIDFWKVELYWGEGEFRVPIVRTILSGFFYLQAIPMQILKILFILLIPYNIIRSFKQKNLNIETIISLLVLAASVLQAFATYGTNTRYSFPFEILIILSVLLNVLPYIKSRFFREKAA